MNTTQLKCSIESARRNLLPPGYVLIVKGDRIKKGDLQPDGMGRDEWKEVPVGFIGKKADGSVAVVRRLPDAPPAPDLTEVIREKVNKLEERREIIRSEIDNPPEGGVTMYYFTDRLDEVRTLSLMIDAIRQLAQ